MLESFIYFLWFCRSYREIVLAVHWLDGTSAEHERGRRRSNLGIGWELPEDSYGFTWLRSLRQIESLKRTKINQYYHCIKFPIMRIEDALIKLLTNELCFYPDHPHDPKFK